jgi:unsaturated rhamnogalacturonyl hydrolase
MGVRLFRRLFYWWLAARAQPIFITFMDMGRFLTFLAIALLLNGALLGQRNASPTDSTLAIMKKVADWQLDHWRTSGMRWPAYDWVNGACYTGLNAYVRVSRDTACDHALYAIGEKLDWNTGPHRTMADDYCIGQLYAELYRARREPKIIARFRAQADSICSLPHTESLEWGNDIHLREWAWCDALFMGPAGLAELSWVTGDLKYLVTADSLWWKTTAYLYSPADSLFFRDSRYFQQREPNGRKMFWSRGNGWVLAGLVRVLDVMPADYPGRGRFLALFRQMAARIRELQQPDGSWRTSLLDPSRYPNPEMSGTAFYCYALAWGVNHGVLNSVTYRPAVSAAWTALKRAVQPDGRLGFVQQIGDQPGSADANSTEAYGVGGFLLAGSQIFALEGGSGR